MFPQSLPSKPSTQNAALLQLTYGDTDAVGPGSYIEWTGAADLIFIPLMADAGQQGSTWIIYNSTAVNVRVQLEEISGTNKGAWFGDGVYSSDGREVEILPGETCRVTSFQFVSGGIHRFN